MWLHVNLVQRDQTRIFYPLVLIKTDQICLRFACLLYCVFIRFTNDSYANHSTFITIIIIRLTSVFMVQWIVRTICVGQKSVLYIYWLCGPTSWKDSCNAWNSLEFDRRNIQLNQGLQNKTNAFTEIITTPLI